VVKRTGKAIMKKDDTLDNEDLVSEIEVHSMLLGTLMAVLLEDRIDIKERMLKVLKRLESDSSWTATDRRKVLNEATRFVQSLMPQIH
jgi:hypothetical protein